MKRNRNQLIRKCVGCLASLKEEIERKANFFDMTMLLLLLSLLHYSIIVCLTSINILIVCDQIPERINHEETDAQIS